MKLRGTAVAITALMMILGSFGLLMVGGADNAQDYTLLRFDERRSGQVPMVGDLTDPVVRWTFDRPGAVLTSPMVADMNDDRRNEVAFGGTDGKVTMLDETGSLIWEVQEKPITSVGSIGDVDGDGLQEVIVTELLHSRSGGLSLIVLNGEDGSEVWRFTPPINTLEEGFATSPILEDINGDGIDDLLIGSMTYRFYALDGPTGTVIWSSKFEHFMRASSPMADIDNDGVNEIVGMDNHALVKFMDVGTGAVEWQGYTGYCSGSTPSIGDLDGDGFGEVVIPMCMDGGMVVLNHDGSTLWQRPEYSSFYASPVLVDVDGDGLEDVVNTDGYTHMVIAYKGTNGQILWSTVLPSTTWAQGAPVSLDIEGDGTVEILAGSDAGFHTLDSRTGAIEWTFLTGRVRGQPFVVDLEKRGGSELVYASGPTVYVLEQRNSPPVPIIDIYREVVVCLRMEGRKWNAIEATFMEDGSPVQTLTMTRMPGSPVAQLKCFALKVRDGKSYSVTFKFMSEGVGANPAKLIFGWGKDRMIPLVFNSQKGKVQEKALNLDGMLASVLMGNRTYVFDASMSHDPDGTIVAYHWEFGDGAASSSMKTRHTYLNPGTFQVTLEVVDDNGAARTASTTLTVN